jgi:hypothetical protein
MIAVFHAKFHHRSFLIFKLFEYFDHSGTEVAVKARLTAISFGLAAVAAVFLMVWPVYSGFDGRRTTHGTLLEVNGAWVIIPVMVPVVVAFLPVMFRKQAVRIVAAIIMLGFTVIGGFSIGLFYRPASIMMLLAACVDDSAQLRDLVR